MYAASDLLPREVSVSRSVGGKGDTPAGRQGQDKGCAGLLKVSTPKESR